jgi:hypothetical protein
MTTQQTATQSPQNTQPDSEAAAKLRRVLSVAEPRKTPDQQTPPPAQQR